MSQAKAEHVQQVDLSDLEPAKSPDLKGIRHEEGMLTSWDGKKLFWQSWSAEEGEHRGRVALMHGYGEHSSRYGHVAVALVRAGFSVMALDARGHGRSEGKDGHVMMYDEYVLDLEKMIDELEAKWGEERGPLHVMGHSNGGLIALRYALRRPRRVSSFVVTSPFLGFKVKVPYWKARAGVLMSRVWPSLALPTELSPRALSHRQAVVDQYAKDPLNKTVATARWFTEATQAQQDLMARASRIEHPVLMLVGGGDEIADAAVAQAVFHELGSEERELEVYEGYYHEILNEQEWEGVMRRALSWLEREHEPIAEGGQ